MLQNLEKQGGQVGIAARLLSSSAATVAEVIRFLASPAERKRYARDVQVSLPLMCSVPVTASFLIVCTIITGIL